MRNAETGMGLKFAERGMRNAEQISKTRNAESGIRNDFLIFGIRNTESGIEETAECGIPSAECGIFKPL